MTKLLKKDFLLIEKKNEIEIIYDSAFSKGNKRTLQPTSKPRFSKRDNLHKLTLTNKNNLNGAKFYAYLRGENVSFAYSDMAISVNSIIVRDQEPDCIGSFDANGDLI